MEIGAVNHYRNNLWAQMANNGIPILIQHGVKMGKLKKTKEHNRPEFGSKTSKIAGNIM